MTRRWVSRIILLVALVGVVALLWQWTAAFDRNDDGEAIDIFGPWLGDEADAFAESVEAFTFLTGIDVRYTGTNDFDADLRGRVSGGLDLPDIAFVPQPALFTELARQNLIVPLDPATVTAVEANYRFDPSAIEYQGDVYFAPYRANLKSIVWYRPDVFTDNGWEVPGTLEELLSLTDEIAASGTAPWCFSLESGSSTGWAASDWIEDLVLRRAGAEVYESWAVGDTDFADPDIVDAFETFDRLLLTPGHTLGGIQRILSTPVEDAGAPLFAREPGCAMYKQATFAVRWFPDDVEVGEEVDFFVLPVDGDGLPPLLTGGEGAVQFTDRPEVISLMTYLVNPDGSAEWAQRGGFLSARDSVDRDYYAESEQPFFDLVLEERDLRFDASDRFPSSFRDVYLATLTEHIGETSYLGVLADLEGFLRSLDVLRDAAE